jgi:hypothetical protein
MTAAVCLKKLQVLGYIALVVMMLLKDSITPKEI